MADGGPKLKNKWCSKKIENVPTCLGNTHVHVHGELQIQKFKMDGSVICKLFYSGVRGCPSYVKDQVSRL